MQLLDKIFKEICDLEDQIAHHSIEMGRLKAKQLLLQKDWLKIKEVIDRGKTNPDHQKDSDRTGG